METKRTLFIGLGGTGGHVVRRLHAMMSEEQKKDANYLYIDVDKKDTDKQMDEGIQTVRISSADSVEQIARSLGKEDGVYDWLPVGNVVDGKFIPNPYEGEFRTSQVDNGAAQSRFKSRLCFANFFADEQNELRAALRKLSAVGANMEGTTLYVMIVSSVAGGTGAGSFLDVALYVRRYFRDIGQEINIIGLFACPEIFFTEIKSKEERLNCTANAYAAIRELNAMNIACSDKSAADNEYGKGVKIKICTKSEGPLFDATDPKFTQNNKAKPFDLLYFVDDTNEKGGVLPSIHAYYNVMADIAYTRMYSVLEDSVRQGESNEMNSHTQYPTAIYGSAGFAKIIYPYEDILKYLAERRVAEELDEKWRYCEKDWAAYCSEQQHAADEDGVVWEPTDEEREDHYLDRINESLENKPSILAFMEGMILKEGKDRAEAYLQRVKDNAYIKTGLDGDDAQEDGAYSICKDADVGVAREELLYAFANTGQEMENPLEILESLSTAIESKLENYTDLIDANVEKQARLLASAIFSTVEGGASLFGAKEISLKNGLLSDEKKAVHPLAARYLLYQLRKLIRIEALNYKQNHNMDLKAELAGICKALRFHLDPNKEDERDIDVHQVVTKLEKEFSFLGSVRKKATWNLEEYRKQFGATMAEISAATTECVLYLTYERLMPILDELIHQYESFFENIDQFAAELKRAYEVDEIRHNYARDRYIYVGASSRMKDYYYCGQPSVASALEQGSKDVYAAEGKAIYEALEKRVVEKFERERANTARRRHPDQEVKDDYHDLSHVFRDVTKTYVQVLKDRAGYLNADVVTVIAREVCRKLNVTENDIQKADVKTRFYQELKDVMNDLTARARPMVRYQKHNDENYYAGEKDVSKLYQYVSVSTDTAKKLSEYFAPDPAASNEEILTEFRKAAGLESQPVINPDFGTFEIGCFTAIHCLQPTQINKFNENNDYSYYRQYVEKIRRITGRNHPLLSLSPHLDKTWHKRGMMPYISRNLEITWRKDLVKAFLFLVLSRNISFTKDEVAHVWCFNSTIDGTPKYIQWPENRLVLRQNISRIMEYLAEDENLVRDSMGMLDKVIEYQKEILTGYLNEGANYKTGLTNLPLMTLLRYNTLNAFGKEDVKLTKVKVTEEGGKTHEEEQLVNAENTMGGVLQIAWLLHRSEENLGEDRDFGEELLKVTAEIIDQFCRQKYGNDLISDQSSANYAEYMDLYNTQIENMLKAYVQTQRIMAKKTAAEEQGEDRGVSVEKLKKSTAVFHTSQLLPKGTFEIGGDPFADLAVPEEIRSSEAYVWITKNWHKKG